MSSDKAATLDAARRKLRTAAWRLWWLWAAVTLILFAIPIGNRILRASEVGTLLILWAGLIALNWSRLWLRWSLVALTAGLALFLAWPTKSSADAAELRADYLAALRRYEGVRYVWGGENRFGIDCSGLTRRAMIDTLLTRGFTRADPASLRAGLSLWWRDCSAKTLGAGGQGQTVSVMQTASLNTLDATRIAPGDLAVTESGVHILAHLGNGEWIQADTVPMRVVRTQSPSNDAWFSVPMKIVRWRVLSSPP